MSQPEDEERKGIVENAGAPVPGEERDPIHAAALGGGIDDLGGGGAIGGDAPDRDDEE